MNILGEFYFDVFKILLVICVSSVEFQEEFLIGQGAVVQVSHDGRPSLVLKVFIMDQTLTERAKLLGNLKHFLKNGKISGIMRVV